MKRFSFLHTVRGRLLLLAIGIEVIMLTVLVANSLRLLHGAMTSQARWQAAQMAPVLNASLKAPLAQRDFVTVQAVLDESRVTEGIDYIVITDSKGHRVASSGWPLAQPLPAPTDGSKLVIGSLDPLYNVAVDIMYSNQRLGVLQFGLDLTNIIAARTSLLTQGIAIALLEIVCSSLILMLIGLWLTRNLGDITRASLEVAAGNLTPQKVPEGKDDVGQLGVAFNIMSQAIAERVRELTAAKEAAEASEQAKSASEERLQLVLDGSNDGIWDWDIRTGNIEINKRWATMLGYELDEIVRNVQTWVDMVHPEDLPRVQEALQEHLDGKVSLYETEHRVRSKSGEWIWILDRGKVVERDAGGTPLRAAGTHTDITERKKVLNALHTNTMMLEDEIAYRQRIQEELAEKQVQLETINNSLQERIQKTVSELREKDQVLISQSRQAAMGEMIGNIAHQWRQPLNALAMAIANIQGAYQHNELTEEYMTKAVGTANRLIQKMSTTINDFRNFFKPDKEIVAFSALEQIKCAIALVESGLKSRNITISLDAPEDCMLVGFPNEYSQVLLNLLSNAKDAVIESNSENGTIDVFLLKQGENGCVSVRDNGGGITVDVLDKIFEPYFSTKKMGTGIGLYMSKMIIERNMNGKILACNIKGGSEFTVITPLEGGCYDQPQA